MRDSFLTVQAFVLEVYTRKICVTISLPCRLCARSLHKKDVRDNFLTVQAVCARSLHKKEVRGNFLTMQAVCSKFTQKKTVTITLP